MYFTVKLVDQSEPKEFVVAAETEQEAYQKVLLEDPQRRDWEFIGIWPATPENSTNN